MEQFVSPIDYVILTLLVCNVVCAFDLLKNNIVRLLYNFIFIFVEYIIKAVDKKNQDIAYFLSFCIEQYKNAKGIDGTEAMEIFLKYGVLDYLNEHFEILHTQNSQWILEDIDEFIELRKDKRI